MKFLTTILSSPVRWLSRRSVATRLTTGFGFLLLFVVLVGLLGVGGMYRLHSRVDEIVQYNNAKLGYAQAMYAALAEQEKGLLYLILATSSKEKQEVLTKIKFQSSQYEEAAKGVAEMFTLTPPTDFEKSTDARLQKHEQSVSPMIAKIIALVDEEKTEEALKLLHASVKPALQHWVIDTEEMVSIEQRLNDAASAATSQDYTWVRTITITCILLAILIGTVIALLILVGLRRELGGEPAYASAVAEKIANGDLTAQLKTLPGDSKSLMAAMKIMQEKLYGMVKDIGQATAQLTINAEQVSSATQQTSRGAQQQQAETDQLATAIHEMAATVQEVARNAAQAASAAQHANEAAAKGKSVVQETTNVINSLVAEIGSSAGDVQALQIDVNNIGKVLDVIRGIAEQTNLLALNAAIEAARAGEQGRGFAVVADEVRTLASRTQESTREIQQMIEHLQGGARKAVTSMELSQKQTQTSATMAASAADSLNIIVDAVATITDMNTQIATAAEEQSAVAEEINRSVVNIRSVAGQTTECAQHTTKALDGMNSIANLLQTLIGRFRV